MKAKDLPSIEWLNEWLHYDAEAGKLYWKKQRHPLYAIAGSEAGGLHPRGYIRVGIQGNYYQAHRICWTIYHQEMLPTDAMLDHINGERSDNRICNLRLVEVWENSHNRYTQLKESCGVTYNSNQSKRKPWVAYITINKVRRYLGTYETYNEAVAARRQAEEAYGVDALRSVTRGLVEGA